MYGYSSTVSIRKYLDKFIETHKVSLSVCSGSEPIGQIDLI